jgi:hypothetical protein
MTPLLTPLAFSLLAWLLIDGTSAWHTDIRDHDMLAFGHSRRAPVVTKREPTSTSSRRKQGAAHLVDADIHSEPSSRSSSILHSRRLSHDPEYSHTVDASTKSTPRHSNQQETRTRNPLVRSDHDENNTTEEEDEMERLNQLAAAADMTACMPDFGCF